MKRKLLLAALCVVGAVGMRAQTDVTETYLSNPGFESNPIFDGTSLGSNAEDAKENATPTTDATLVEGAVNVYEITGWTQMTTETSDFARVFTMPYNTTLYVGGNGSAAGQTVTAPENASSVTAENQNLLFVEANWCGSAILGVKQSPTLPAGVYKLTFDSYVTNTLANAKSLCGVKVGDTGTYKWPTAANTWTNNEIIFVVNESSVVEISMGYVKSRNVIGGSSAFLFVDNVKLYQLTESVPVGSETDITSVIVNPNADSALGNEWTGSKGRNNNSGFDGKAGFFEPSDWNATGWEKSVSQTLTSLPAGLYTLKAAVQSASGVITALVAGNSYSETLPANGDSNGTISADGSVVAAGSGVAGWNYGTTTAWVTDGTLTIGAYSAASATHCWTNMDNFTLSYISAEDLLMEALPEDGAMAANKWYYFDVENAGGYILTGSENLENVIYTTDIEEALEDNASESLEATMTLAKGRYYVKSSSAQTLTYALDALDLTEEIEAYKMALENANTAKAKKMASSYLEAINAAITTYGDIDTEGTQNTAMKNALAEATEALSNAVAAAATSINSYAIIAAGVIPDDKLDGWTCTNSNAFHINTWSSEGNPGNDPSGMVTPFIENWVGKGTYLGVGTVSYTLEGLEPDEVYYASALVRSYNEANSEAPNGPNFFINDEETDLTSEGTTFTYNGMSGIYATIGATATVGADGKLTLGVKIADDVNYNWVAFKSVSIRSIDDAYAAAVEAAEALEGQIPADAYTALAAVVSANSAKTVASINAINAAVEEKKPLVTPYAAYLAMKDAVQALYDVTAYEELVDGAHETLGSAIEDAANDVEMASTVEGIEEVAATLQEAGVTYAGAANPTDEDKPFDLTFLLTNPDVTEYWTGAWGVRPEGWYNDQEGGNFQVMANEEMAPGGEVFMEYYKDNPAITEGFALYQKVTLPVGTFKMTGRTGAPRFTSNVTFSANEIDGTLISGAISDASIEFVNNEKQEVKIGLKAHAGNTTTWMAINNIHLYKVPAKSYTIDEDVDYDYTQNGAGDVTLTRTIKAGVNTIVLPFSLTQEEVEEAFGEGSKVYEVGAYEDENISFKERSGISPNVPCLLVATEAVTSYEFEGRTIVAADNAAVESAAVDGVTIVGSYVSATVPTDSYVISNGNFFLVDDAQTMKPTRAYFNIPEAADAGIKVLSFTLEGEEGATAIAGIAVAGAENGAVYSISGQKVNAAYKGIVIKNGKKYLQK